MSPAYETVNRFVTCGSAASPTLTSMLNVLLPTAMGSRFVQLTAAPLAEQFQSPLLEAKVKPGGNVSLTVTTSSVVEGPRLVTLTT